MNELQVAAAAPQREAGFSLYSTDTEEQMASVNRGLDRCATLLKCLLSPDSGSQRREKNQNVGMAKRRIAGRHGNKVLMKQTKKHTGVSSEQPRFPGALKHLHTHTTHTHPPHASSTPIKRHVRSKTEPLPVETAPTTSVSPTSEGSGEPVRKQVRVHRRLKSACTQRRKPGREYRPLIAEKKRMEKPRPLSTDHIPNKHPHYWPLAPYHHPMYYHPLCSCYYPYWQETRRPPRLPTHSKQTKGQLSAPSLQSRSLPSFTKPNPCAVPTSNGLPSNDTGLHMIESLTQEMQRSVEECLRNSKQVSGEGSTQVQTMVDELYQMLSQHCEQLQVQCQHLSRGGVEQPLSSTLELITQLQHLESEKSQLFERVLKSDAAYSESRRELEKMTRRQYELQNEMKQSRSQVETLRKSLQFKEERLGKMSEQFKTAEEDSEKTRHMVHQLTTKSSLLQHQVDTLRQELSQHNNENLKGHGHLAQVRCSLEAAQDEVEMMKVSLSAKEEQLVQCQDKLLGLRQCLAYFLSELTKMKPPDGSPPIPVDYCVSGQAVERIHSLVNDGNIETFLVSYSDQTKPSSQLRSVGSPSPSGHADDSTSTSLTLTPPTQAHSSHHHQGTPTNDVISPLQSSQTDHTTELPLKSPEEYTEQPPMEADNQIVFPLPSKPPSSSSLSTITGLSGMTTSSELEFRRDLATLDHDIARLQMQFKIAMHVAPR